MKKVHPKVEEAVETLDLNPVTRRRLLAGTGLASASLAAVALLDACGKTETATGAVGNFPKTPNWKFVFVCHVTTNPFFTPTQSGASDACKLLGCSYQWTGSQNSNVGEMVSAMNSAVSAGVDGIGVCLVDLHAFNGPTTKALDAKVPVVAYNADAAGNARLAYIGQDLFVSGQEMGQRIAQLVPSGDVALFIATPGSLNIQPRIDGAQAALKSHSSIKTHVVTTGAQTPQELSVIDSYATAHPNTKGYFAVDAGSTQSLAQTIKKHNLRGQGVKGGGYDLTPITQQLLAAGQIDFTIDQQPYLQGFLPILELYLYQVTQTLTGMADVNTGLKFLDKTTVVPYNSTKSRYEGTSTGVGVQKS